MGVTQSGVGDREPGLGPQPRRPLPRADLGEQLPGAGRRRPGRDGRQQAQRVDQRGGRPPVAVDGAGGQPVEQPAGAVGTAVPEEQPRPVVQERRGHPAGEEVLLGEQPLQELHVRAHAADPELRQRPAGPRGGLRQIGPAGGHLDQQRVEVRGDLHALVDRPVQPDARAARGLVSGDLSGVRAEPVRRILGGHPALHRGPADADRLLGQAQVGQGGAAGDPQLCHDQVDAGDLLGDGVLDLDTRVHLHEGVRPVGGDQELHRAGVDVADVPGERQRVRAQPVPHGGVEQGSGRDLDDLLVTSLHRAVPLVEVDDLAGGVAEDLHLDVPGPVEGLLEEDRAVPEGRRRLPDRARHRVFKVFWIVHPAQAAATTARRRLHEQREAHGLGGGQRGGRFGHRRRGPQHRQARGHRGLTGGHLVPGQPQHRRRGADEGDPGQLARVCQRLALGQEAVSRVQGVRADPFRHRQQGVDVQIAADGVAGLADLVGLVSLCPVL